MTEGVEGVEVKGSSLDHLDDFDHLCSKGNGSTGVPSHHRETSVDRAIAK